LEELIQRSSNSIAVLALQRAGSKKNELQLFSTNSLYFSVILLVVCVLKQKEVQHNAEDELWP